jgi:hypothetical protein
VKPDRQPGIDGNTGEHCLIIGACTNNFSSKIQKWQASLTKLSIQRGDIAPFAWQWLKPITPRKQKLSAQSGAHG